MTDATLLRLIQDPARLLDVDRDVLLRTVEQYPYSANLQLLAALWSELHDQPDREYHLRRAATLTFDRTALYHRLQRLIQWRHDLLDEEESLELLSLDDLEEAEPLLSPAPGEDTVAAGLATPHPDEPVAEERAYGDTPFEIEDFDADDISIPFLNSLEATELRGYGNAPFELEDYGAEDIKIPFLPPEPGSTDKPAERPKPSVAPEDPKQFDQRRIITTKQELRERLMDIRRRQAATEQEQEQNAKSFARRSLVPSEGVISATLAEVFIRQGQYQHAIRIYEQLALANPEKSPIFAALIKDLKRKL